MLSLQKERYMNFRKATEEGRTRTEALLLLSISALLIAGCGGGGESGHSVPGLDAQAPMPIETTAVGTTSAGDAAVVPPIVELQEVVPTVVESPVVVSPVGAYTFSGYRVTGNTIYDKSSGKPHMFRGVDSPSMDWQVNCDHCTLDQFQLMRQDWKANVVRLSVNQNFWLPGSAQYSAGYAPELARVVAAIEHAGMDVILDNHRSGSPYMADADSVVFWREVATVYKDDPHVLFELFNEPNQISWDVWLNGGNAPSGPVVHGMQELYNTVRTTGADNLVVIGGINWAYDLSGVPTHRVVGSNIVYNTHPYNYPGKQPDDWDRGFGFLAKTDPVIATEFGNYDCTKAYYQSFVNYAKAHQISWSAWAWFPGGCGFPAIVSDWNGTPNAAGEVVKEALLNP